MVTLRRTSSNCCSLKSVTSTPSTKIRPESAFINPMMCFSETDFPTPLRPMITQVSARFTVKLTFFSTSFSSKDLHTSRNSKKFSACGSALRLAGSVSVASDGLRAPPGCIAATPRLISFASFISRFLQLERPLSQRLLFLFGFHNPASLLVIRRRIHVPEEPPSAIKSFPVPLVKNFRLQLSYRRSNLAHAFLELILDGCARVRPPSGAQRLRSLQRMRKDHLRSAPRRSLREKRHPVRSQERHVAAQDQVPHTIWLVVLCVEQSGHDPPQRSFARPAILHNCHAELGIFSGRRNNLHFFCDSPHQIDHSRQHRLSRELDKRLVAPKSRASAASQNIRHDLWRIPKACLTNHKSPVTSHSLRAVRAQAAGFPVLAAFPASFAGAARSWPPSSIHSNDVPPIAS